MAPAPHSAPALPPGPEAHPGRTWGLGAQPPFSCTQGAAPGDPESLATVTVQCVLTLSLTAPRGADLSRLRALMSEALPPHAQRAQLRWAGTAWRGGKGPPGWPPLGLALQEGWAHQRLVPPKPLAHAAPSEVSLCSYQDPSEDGRWVPLSGEEALRRAWRDAAGPGGLHLQCRVSGVGSGGGRPFSQG